MTKDKKADYLIWRSFKWQKIIKLWQKAQIESLKINLGVIKEVRAV